MDLLCRFCGLDLGNDEKCLITKSSVIIKFYRSLPNEVRTNDSDLPKNCCSLCNIKICEFVEFHDAVLTTDRKLKIILLKRTQPTNNKVMPPAKHQCLDRQSNSAKYTSTLKSNDKLDNSKSSSVSVIYDKLKAKSGITISKFVESDDENEDIDSECKHAMSQPRPVNDSSDSDSIDNEKEGATKRKRNVVKNRQIISLENMQPKFICTRCKGKFKSLDAVRRHLETNNDCKDINIFCYECKRVFKTRRMYSKHGCVRRAREKNKSLAVCV